ncbi:MAG: aldo/keto reductase [Thermoproteota archaeon]|jgi:aryl-alcohol dehydrogenase-like predicted oxidoreductase|nr:aldo/keto reductase [Thermoproteota archaeon]MEC8529290.1 aldo/keto reductase [Thermoproteota archaeon]MEC9063089.1 aldo/keto reductase [Thermoproteota archaeon]MEC9073892.1 aldo/keto reductase [Thermoproteota archaeon]MEC9416339.1 aldo/keto reductase [Thermoproteota archaeon]
MWQVAGGHGQINHDSAISQMLDYNEKGFNTWDMADIYGPAESFYGDFRNEIEKKKGKNELEKIQGFTKFVPNPGSMTRSIVEHYIDQSMKKMNVDVIDVIQFHWWDYNDANYIDALHELTNLRDNGKISHLALTNFDTERMQVMVDDGIQLVSNQVQYSIIDQRPNVKMASFCKNHDMKILAYGTLLGGLLTENYLGVPKPTQADLDTYSLQKYMNMIDAWGGWNLFQELLVVLDDIAKKHNVQIANVATRFILDRPAVAGTIIGSRLGLSDHIEQNSKTFSLQLQNDDFEKIKSVTSKANNLFESIGDCGGEYR